MSVNEDVSVDSFLRGLVRDSITSFILAVTTDPKLAQDLCKIDLVPDAVAAFARERGYAFSEEDLRDFIEDRLAATLSAAELEDRRRYLRYRADGTIPDPADAKERDTVPQLARYDVISGFVLDRQEVLRGGVAMLHEVPGIDVLTARIAATLQSSLQQDDLQSVHRHMDFNTLRRRTTEAYDRLTEDTEIPPLMAAVIEALGMDPRDVLYEWPGFRVMTPASCGGHGAYRANYSGALGPHRDTWYGSPQHQINVWGPVCPLEKDGTLRVLPRFFLRRVANSTRGFDSWHNYAGLSLSPGPRETVPADEAVAPPLKVGDMICFAAQQLHASAPNRTERTRVSFEFRLLHRDDAQAAYVPTNVDYYGVGEIYKGWYDINGKEVVRFLPDR